MLQKQKKALSKSLEEIGYGRGTKVAPEVLQKEKKALSKRLEEYGYGRGTKVAPEVLQKEKKALRKHCREVLVVQGNRARVAAARQAKGEYREDPRAGVTWIRATKKWMARLRLPNIDGKGQLYIVCGCYPTADQAAAAIEAKCEELGLPADWRELSEAKLVEVMREAQKKLEATKAEKLAIPEDPKSGHVGVRWNKAKKKWCARVGIGQGKEHHIGWYHFKDLDKAVAAVAAFRAELAAKRAELDLPPAKKRRLKR